MSNSSSDTLVVFRSPLTWVAAIYAGDVLKNVSLGTSAEAAVAGLDPALRRNARKATRPGPLARRLIAYLSGEPDNFLDVSIDPGPLTPFQRNVVRLCRDVALGSTVSYGQLAALAGSPGAARAVGNCMARNRIPLVVPCHRVVGSDGRLHGYSASGGVGLKRRLLTLETEAISGRMRRQKS